MTGKSMDWQFLKKIFLLLAAAYSILFLALHSYSLYKVLLLRDNGLTTKAVVQDKSIRYLPFKQYIIHYTYKTGIYAKDSYGRTHFTKGRVSSSEYRKIFTHAPYTITYHRDKHSLSTLGELRRQSIPAILKQQLLWRHFGEGVTFVVLLIGAILMLVFPFSRSHPD